MNWHKTVYISVSTALWATKNKINKNKGERIELPQIPEHFGLHYIPKGMTAVAGVNAYLISVSQSRV